MRGRVSECERRPDGEFVQIDSDIDRNQELERMPKPRRVQWLAEDVQRGQLQDPPSIARWWQAAVAAGLAHDEQLPQFVAWCCRLFRLSGDQITDARRVKRPGRLLVISIADGLVGRGDLVTHWSDKAERRDHAAARLLLPAVERALGLSPAMPAATASRAAFTPFRGPIEIYGECTAPCCRRSLEDSLDELAAVQRAVSGFALWLAVLLIATVAIAGGVMWSR